ncbi:MAG: tetratricopeptide repeat protein [Bacteroidota bacterium]
MDEAVILSVIDQAKRFLQKKQLERAYQLLSETIHELEEGNDLLSENPLGELYILRGTALLMEHEGVNALEEEVFQQILSDFDHAVDFVPDEPTYYYLRGSLYMNADVHQYQEEARKDFSDALRFNKGHLDSLKGMGELFFRLEDFDKAIYYYTHVIEQAEEPSALAMRAMANYRKLPPSLHAAAQDFRRSLELEPAQEDLYFWLSQLMLDLDDQESAIKVYDQLISIFPDHAGHYVDRGVLKIELDPEGALADYNQALAIEENPLAYNNRADYYRRMGEYEKAANDAREALRVAPESSISYATLAEIYADSKEEDLFFQNLEKAISSYYTDAVEMMSTAAFEPYLSHPTFLTLLKKLKEK